jgi:ankyrin repeat protein
MLVHSAPQNRLEGAMEDVSNELRIPLMRAIRTGNLDVARHLSARVPVEADLGDSPTMWACDAGNAEALRLCIDLFGPHPYAPGRPGPIHLASMHGNEPALRVLLEAGADPNAADQDGQGPLRYAASGIPSGNNGMCVQLLLRAGAEPNARALDGKSALMAAVSRNDGLPFPELAKASDPTVLDKSGRTAMDHAHERGAAWAVAEIEAKLLAKHVAAPSPQRARRL